MKYSNRSPWKRIFYSPISIIIGAILLFLLARAAWGIHEKAVVADTKLQQVQQELVNLQNQKAELANSIQYLSTPEGIEATLRDKYHAVKDGESVAVIVDVDASATPSSTQIVEQNSKSFWQKILNFIGL